MHTLKTSLFLAILISFGVTKLQAFSLNDTISPSFIVNPSDTSFNCDADIDSFFTEWYNNFAGSLLDDGDANILATIPLNIALDSLLSMPVNCLDSGLISIGYFGIDSCNNISIDTFYASFIITDNTKPLIVQSASNDSIICNSQANEALYAWINNIGGAIATDNCNDSITWINFIWEDNQGHNGFANIGDNYNIPITRDSCEWHINVSFFVRDFCGNINNTRASFFIIKDTLSPELQFFPNDTTILCGQVLDTIAPQFIDVCDQVVELRFVEENTQDIDTLLCEFYNYKIKRTWTAVDVCMNSTEYVQNINVVDTIPPTAVFNNLVVKGCDENLSNVNDFIQTSDNCSHVTATFSDSIVSSNVCQTQILRTWILSDACNHMRTFEQSIQTTDFTAPEFIGIPKDTLISCDEANKDQAFQDWLTNFGGAVVEDNCNLTSLYVRSASNLTDTAFIISSPDPTLTIENCNPMPTNNNVVSVQEVNFYAFDNCGNISFEKANFTIIDTVAPTINNCPIDLEITLEENECEKNVILSLPDFTDACLSQADAEWHVTIDEFLEIPFVGNTVSTTLDIGEHKIQYSIFDCAQNESSCIQNISLVDIFPPTLTCPNDFNINLGFNECESTFSIPELINFSDNCFGSSDFQSTRPDGNALINFEFDAIDSIYKAVSFPVEFDGIVTEGRLFKPSIIIEYALKTQTNGRVILKSEFGDDLFIIENADCSYNKERLVIDENQFIVWSLDNDIKFTVLFESNTNQATIPCDSITSNNTIVQDDISFFKITLQFSDVVPTFFIEDNDDNVISENISEVTLGQGQYELVYQALDFGQNLGECRTEINVNDITSPTISCSDQAIEINIDSVGPLDIDLDNLSIFIIDNCEISDASFFPSQISCLDIGKVVPINVQAVDNDNNFTNCTANVSISGTPLTPTFVSGLCFADSLKLFSNVDPSIIMSYNWNGPNNYESSEANPILTNITNQNAGVYTLNITTQDGCGFSGMIDVQINQFSSPQISSTATSYCIGDEVLLNSNAFTENVDYFWYEGVSPNGILIDETDGPSLKISPSLGQHLYYVQVIGEGCNSNPSSTLAIEVLPAPQATINEAFITICEGDDIALSTDVFQSNYTYEWRGPNAYFSNEQFAEVISNAEDINAGQYTLVINNGACSSLPAVAEVIIFDPPIQPIIEGESVFCEGQSAVLTVSNISNATRYHWYFNGNIFTSVSNNNLLIPSISSAQTGEWTVVVEDAICFSDTSEVFEVFVESSLNVGASNNGPVCDGDSIVLTSTFIPNATYRWQDPSGNFYSGREIEIPAIDGIYSVTIITASNCIATTTTNVEVGIRPDITALSNSALNCMDDGQSISFASTIFPSGNYQYQWSGPNNFNSTQIQPTIQNINQDDAGTYQLVVIQNNCASEPALTNVDFTINPEPAILEGDEKLCVGEDLLLTVTNPIQGMQTLWIWSTPIGTITTTDPFLNLPDFNTTQTGSYTVVQQLNGCRSDASPSKFISIEINPPQPIIEGESFACEASGITLIASFENNAEYVWLTPNGTISTDNNSLELSNLQLSDNGEYRVFIQKTNCASDTSDIFNLEILPTPQSPSFNDALIEICADENQSLEICVNATNIDFDKLVILDQLTNTTIQESTSSCFDLSFLIGNVSQSFILDVAAIKNDCQSPVTSSLTLNIFESPDAVVSINLDTLFLCNQDFININPDVIPNNTDVIWSSPDPEINIFNTDPYNPSFSNLREGGNQIIATSSFGSCTNYGADSVIVFVISEINAEDDVVEGNYNETTIVNVLSNDIYSAGIFINAVENPNQGSIIIDGQNIIIPQQTNFIGSYQLQYEICYIDCPDLCSQAFITVNIGDNVDCFAGNLITPNGDGYNDQFVIPCLESGNYNNNSLVIFNQWGDEVFSASPYLNNWEGTFQNGNLPDGTYFYILELGESTRPIQGFIVIEN